MVNIQKNYLKKNSKAGKQTPEVKPNGCYWADSVKSQRTVRYQRLLPYCHYWLMLGARRFMSVVSLFTLTPSLPPFCTWVNRPTQSWFDLSKPISSRELSPLHTSTPCFSPVLKHSQQSNTSFTWLSRIWGWIFYCDWKRHNYADIFEWIWIISMFYYLQVFHHHH